MTAMPLLKVFIIMKRIAANDFPSFSLRPKIHRIDKNNSEMEREELDCVLRSIGFGPTHRRTDTVCTLVLECVRMCSLRPLRVGMNESAEAAKANASINNNVRMLTRLIMEWLIVRHSNVRVHTGTQTLTARNKFKLSMSHTTHFVPRN